MPLCASNDETRAVAANAFWSLLSGQSPTQHEQKTTQCVWKKSCTEKSVTLTAAVGKRLSEVPEVEKVFLECDQEDGTAYRVLSIIDVRDPEIRARVYAKEQAVMDAFPGLNFSFRVICRAGRNLSEVVDGVGRLVYERG